MISVGSVALAFFGTLFTGGVLAGGLLGGVLGRTTSGLVDDDATSPGGGSRENFAGSFGAGGGCIGADVAEVCGGTLGLLLAIFGLLLNGVVVEAAATSS